MLNPERLGTRSSVAFPVPLDLMDGESGSESAHIVLDDAGLSSSDADVVLDSGLPAIARAPLKRKRARTNTFEFRLEGPP
eukprot:1923724-Alexandrium_andersonii.AAC.1